MKLTSDRQALIEQVEAQLASVREVCGACNEEVSRLERELSEARGRRRAAVRDCESLARSLRELNGEAAESRRRKRDDVQARVLFEEEGGEE